MAAGFMGPVVVFGVIAAAFLHCAVAQTVHVVGDSMGWTIPQGGGNGAYVTWASTKNFVVGDILQFNFAKDDHDVLQVPKASYDACSSNNPIGSKISTGPANITLNSAGEHFYICTFSQHCQLGQKLSITVSSTPGTSPPSTTTPTPTPPATPSPSGTPADCAPVPTPSPKASGPSPQTSPRSPSQPAMGPTPPGSSASGVFASVLVTFWGFALGLLFY